MNKLQLYITKSCEGYKILFNINPSDEVRRHIRELRGIVDKVRYDASEKNIFYYVTTINSGTFVTILRTIPSNPVDHLAAWIYIPNELIIDAEVLERVVNTTTRKVSGERVTTDDVANLRELFSTEYMTDAEAPSMTPSRTGGAVAWRAYNGDTGITLKTLFGPGLFQLTYLDYAGVLFVDADLGLKVEGTDLTKTPINGPSVILPAKPTAEHFVAHIFGQPLERPLRATRDNEVDVVWKHAGFEDVVCRERIESGEFRPTAPDTSKSRKAVTTGSFQIMAQSGRVPLDDCTITVNGVEITNEPSLFTTAELAAAVVTINCDGYAPYSAKMDLATSTRALIRLQERTKLYCFEMPVKSADLGAPVRFKLYTKKTVTASPIEGYVAQDDILEGETRTNHLAYSNPGATMVNKIVYIAIGVVVGFILGCLVNCGGGNRAETHVDSVPEVSPEQATEAIVVENVTVAKVLPEPEPKTAPAEPAPAPETPAPAPDVKVNNAAVTAEAIAYLDNNTAWTKEGLEKHACLKGLFDDMNNFRLEKLSGEWATKLAKSSKFTKLASHAKYGMSPKKKAKSQIEGDTFVKGNDTKITYQLYLNRIDPAVK